MFSETFNSDDPFTNSLMDLAMDAVPGVSIYDEFPPTTTQASTSYDYSTASTASDPSFQQRTRRPSILIEDDDVPAAEQEQMYSQPSPPKRMRFTINPNAPYRRIPCKARGMSNKHNANTAFIHIPLDAPHGLLLRCSNAECAESGRRFRYCKVCVLPVAKRNFPKRHGHGLIDSSNDLKEVDYSSTFINPAQPSTMMMMGSNSNGCQPCGGVGDEELSDAASIARTYMANRQIQQQRVLDEKKMRISCQASSVVVEAPVRKAPISAARTYMDKLCDDRRRKEEMQSVFEPPAYVLPQKTTAPSPQVDTAPKDPVVEKLSSREKEWLTLLKERPELEDDDKMSSWMDKIICFWPDEFAFHESSIFTQQESAPALSSTVHPSRVSPTRDLLSVNNYDAPPQVHSPTSVMDNTEPGDEYFAKPVSTSTSPIPSMDCFDSVFDPSPVTV